MLRGLYLFAGAKRKSGLAGALARACARLHLKAAVEEYDILQGGTRHDLTNKTRQRRLMAKIRQGSYDIIAAPPPLATLSAGPEAKMEQALHKSAAGSILEDSHGYPLAGGGQYPRPTS